MSRTLKKTLIGLISFLLLGTGICYLFPGLIFNGAVHIYRQWDGLKRYEIEVDNFRWVYLAGGKGDTILFIHGFGGDKDHWLTFLKPFRASYHLVVPDLPGFGESSKDIKTSYDIPAQVERLKRFVDLTGLKSFHLVGISMGGYISAYFAGEYPEMVKSMILMDAAGVKSPIPGYVMKRYQKDKKILIIFKTEHGFDEFMSVVFHHPPFVPPPFKAYFAQKGACNYELYKKILYDMNDSGMYLLETRLQKIKAKTLIIWGANDRIIHPSSVEKFERGIKDNRTVIIDQCGHLAYFEKPEQTKRVCLDFLENLK